MKLLIQIPCYNEEKTLQMVIKDLPVKIDGIDIIEYLIINDGSTDKTVEIANNIGVHHIVNIPRNKGLANAFKVGIAESLKIGADIIVNTDGDNQYNGQDIEKLVGPILKGEADIVIGARPIDDIQHFSWTKKKLQRVGTWVVKSISKTDIIDATSGFRAYSRKAALEINVFNKYTYTLETIIQAGMKDMSIISVPVRVNNQLRQSRLMKSIPEYIKKSAITLIRIFILYKPLKFFFSIATVIFAVGSIIGFRFLYYFFLGSGNGHIQSLIFSSILLISAFNTYLIGIISDLLAKNRVILEEIQANLRSKNKE